MEAKKRLFLIVILILLSGCSSLSHKDIVLIDSEIPYKLAPGLYPSIGGELFEVNEQKPRWSVSEATYYEAFVKLEKDKPKTLGIIAIVLICLAIIFVWIRWGIKR